MIYMQYQVKKVSDKITAGSFIVETIEIRNEQKLSLELLLNKVCSIHCYEQRLKIWSKSKLIRLGQKDT